MHIKRTKSYLQCLKEAKDRRIVKVITKVRILEKSNLLTKFKKYLLKIGVKQRNIIHINFKYEMSNVTNDTELYNAIKSKIAKEKTYILLDEIQKVYNWDNAVNKLNADFDVDIYVDGSENYLFSEELERILQGRCLII